MSTVAPLGADAIVGSRSGSLRRWCRGFLDTGRGFGSTGRRGTAWAGGDGVLTVASLGDGETAGALATDGRFSAPPPRARTQTIAAAPAASPSAAKRRDGDQAAVKEEPPSLPMLGRGGSSAGGSPTEGSTSVGSDSSPSTKTSFRLRPIAAETSHEVASIPLAALAPGSSETRRSGSAIRGASHPYGASPAAPFSPGSPPSRRYYDRLRSPSRHHRSHRHLKRGARDLVC